jgi:type IV secretory pathway ATPase VirB11/archaellum biosynthesis ATPase
LLQVPLPDVVSMQTRQPNLEGAGEIPLRWLVKEALRMRPSRVVVREVRQEECLDLTQSARSTTGLPPYLIAGPVAECRSGHPRGLPEMRSPSPARARGNV